MVWVAFLITVYVILGLRGGTTGRGSHLTIFIVTVATLGVVYLLPNSVR
jgi:hypothetical protein